MPAPADSSARDSAFTPAIPTAAGRDSSFAAGAAPGSKPAMAGAEAVEGAFWRSDRLRHFSLSASLALGASMAGASDAESAGFSLSVGLLKEMIDARRGGHASKLDLVADALGVGCGLLLWRALR
jgi:uncharacterized protein YfiM (DUF2279 family)